MTARRFALAPTKTPTQTSGDDQHVPACDGRLDLIEAVYARGAAGRWARPRLFKLCGECPLRLTCWDDKEWRDALKEDPA